MSSPPHKSMVDVSREVCGAALSLMFVGGLLFSYLASPSKPLPPRWMPILKRGWWGRGDELMLRRIRNKTLAVVGSSGEWTMR